MKQYKVHIYDLENARMRIYYILAKDKDDVISKFSNIFRNNPEYIFDSMVELVVDEMPRFEYFRQY